mmetsp:Transcript_23584/g.37874  ORF Transcript_23584/g.37874 Transcript_23584/m.37874 type:complete len:220 (-) Transcript_23584:1191-1850(-)
MSYIGSQSAPTYSSNIFVPPASHIVTVPSACALINEPAQHKNIDEHLLYPPLIPPDLPSSCERVRDIHACFPHNFLPREVVFTFSGGLSSKGTHGTCAALIAVLPSSSRAQTLPIAASFFLTANKGEVIFLKSNPKSTPDSVPRMSWFPPPHRSPLLLIRDDDDMHVTPLKRRRSISLVALSLGGHFATTPGDDDEDFCLTSMMRTFPKLSPNATDRPS